MQQFDYNTPLDSLLNRNIDGIEPIQESTQENQFNQDVGFQQKDYQYHLKSKDRVHQQDTSSNNSDQQTNYSSIQQTRSQNLNSSDSYQNQTNNTLSSDQNDNSTTCNKDEFIKQSLDNLQLIKNYLSSKDPLKIYNDTNISLTNQILSGENQSMLTNTINNNENKGNQNEYHLYEKNLLQVVDNLKNNNKENEIIFQVAITFSNINFFLNYTRKNLIQSQKYDQNEEINDDIKKQQNYYCLCGKFYQQSTIRKASSLHNHLKNEHFQKSSELKKIHYSYFQIYIPFSGYTGCTSSLDKYFEYFESYISTLLKSQLFEYYFQKSFFGLAFVEQLLQDILKGEKIIEEYFSNLQKNLKCIKPSSTNNHNNSLNNQKLKRKQQISDSQNEEFEQIQKKRNKEEQDEPKYTIIDISNEIINIKQSEINRCNTNSQLITQNSKIPHYIETDKGILQFNYQDFYNVSRFGRKSKLLWTFDVNKQKIIRNEQVTLKALEQFGKKKPLFSALAAIHLVNNPTFCWDFNITGQSQLGIINDVFYLFQQYLPYDKVSEFRIQRFEYENIKDMKELINYFSPDYKEKLLVPLYYGKKGDNYLKIIDELEISSNQKLIVLKLIDQTHWEFDIFYQGKHFSSNFNIEEASSEMIDVKKMQFSIFLWQDGGYQDNIKRMIEQDINRSLNLIPDCVKSLFPPSFQSITLYITKNISYWQLELQQLFNQQI
ncbi:hypothetical protein TTHERM_00799210 (macronuclear) [Tetrahymena thermophila SB210]|uniref:Uncharacterized protein n=1 Tax=Tetrahymena thermophila (strain SB210) TaxID=312017 RepID=Q23UA4_TETTS|nr:hypothetical protein TTHERM_00799210 [Tetrahymena thermophila SB210]EAS00161.2 hypothetical protein TTHERM_00799210 [Tetrahymena thermophila SB210]|eukprot:XP_001020406.2 hypothetical protein TTHERM_00799210 [Tetrahymena thermophila SB210]